MKRLLEMDSISQEEIDFLADAVRAGYSILVAGGTGSGKTTFLNALSEFIPEEERVVVIEDTAELQIQHVPNLVRLETRSAGTEDCKEISIRDLIRASLRMRPSRIIVGEVRGAEAFELLTCLNTGHDGSISTCHANSTKDTVARMADHGLVEQRTSFTGDPQTDRLRGGILSFILDVCGIRAAEYWKLQK